VLVGLELATVVVTPVVAFVPLDVESLPHPATKVRVARRSGTDRARRIERR